LLFFVEQVEEAAPELLLLEWRLFLLEGLRLLSLARLFKVFVLLLLVYIVSFIVQLLQLWV
jgi:hypothetical protein